MRHAKRDVLSTQDIEDALRLRNVEVNPNLTCVPALGSRSSRTFASCGAL